MYSKHRENERVRERTIRDGSNWLDAGRPRRMIAPNEYEPLDGGLREVERTGWQQGSEDRWALVVHYFFALSLSTCPQRCE